jgi:signal transduction histidine kinase
VLGDVPVDRPRSIGGWSWLWEAYSGVVVTTTVAATLLNDDQPPRRLAVAVLAIAAMTALHLLVGRRLIHREEAARAALVVLCGQVALFTVTVLAVKFTTWLLFVVIPLIFYMAELPAAIVLVVVANAAPVAATLLRDPAMVRGQLVISVISTAAGTWLGWWISRVIEQSRERGRLIDELESSRAEVARLSHEAGVAAERTRLAGEIHDTLAQGFTSIITLLQAADPALRDERIALAVTTAKENLAESRALIAALSPSALASGSLPDSVRRQATRFEQEAGLPATVRITGAPRALPTAVEVVLLRAAQEALTNVRRHAGAACAQVLLAYDESGVRLVVRDDGHGFEPEAADGFGLSGMRARAAQVDGTLTVRSDAATGTTIEVEVPA